MSVDQMVALDLDELPTDRFELVDEGLEVESLTAGHRAPGIAAFLRCCLCICCCCGSE
jgi:hypothetical protein